jgi:hemerythrin
VALAAGSSTERFRREGCAMTAYRISTEVVWDDFYALELPEIDDQHKALFQIINDLWHAVVAKSAADAIADILRRLEHYAIIHFTAEEALMRCLTYPRLDEHKRAHRLFIDQIGSARRKWADGRPIGLEILDFLNNWLIDHIMTIDKDYAAHYARSGQPLALLSEFFPGE